MVLLSCFFPKSFMVGALVDYLWTLARGVIILLSVLSGFEDLHHQINLFLRRPAVKSCNVATALAFPRSFLPSHSSYYITAPNLAQHLTSLPFFFLLEIVSQSLSSPRYIKLSLSPKSLFFSFHPTYLHTCELV